MSSVPHPSSMSKSRSPRLASLIAHGTLRASNWPGRRRAGTLIRKAMKLPDGEPFEVTTQDGETLHAWALAPKVQDGPNPKLPVVMLHGWMEFKENHLPRAHKLANAGHPVVLYDQRAHGRSTGRVASFGVRETGDLDDVIRGSREQGHLPDAPPITMGFSMGASTVLRHAGGETDVAGVAAFAPFVDLREAINSFRVMLAPWMGRQWITQGFERATRKSGFELSQATTRDAMDRLRIPVLLVEGGADRSLPPEDHVRPILETLRRREPEGLIQHIRIEGATHGSLCQRHWPGLDEQVLAFCAKVSERHASS